MTGDHAPLIEFRNVTKAHLGLGLGVGSVPLRVTGFAVARPDCRILAGFDAGAAEMFVNLVTGAALPDEGDVLIAGRSTREIATDTEWLASLDRFGLVTERAVLLESLAVSANLALPLTLAIESMPAEVRHRVERLAVEVGLGQARLADKASTLVAGERLRVHLARALALDPLMLLLEHPTNRLDPAASTEFGRTLKHLSAARGLGWIALTDDDAFARAAGGTRLRLDAETGKLREDGFWKRIWSKAEGTRQKA